MRRMSWVWILFALWAGLYVASFVVTHFTAPTGDSFVRGANRLMIFIQFQIAATIVAIVIWNMRRAFDKGTWQRWLARAPALLAVGLLVLIIGIIVVAAIGKPSPQNAPYVAPNPMTEPAPAAIAE
nr:hypothetical protein [uncultured Roseovarius sp.]